MAGTQGRQPGTSIDAQIARAVLLRCAAERDRTRMSSSDKVLSILSLFSIERSEWTVEQAALAISQPVSTTYRHFRVLANAGLIDSFGSGRYVLGPAAIQLDWLIRKTDPLLGAAQPAMKFLAGSVSRPAVVLLCRFYRDQVMCIDQAIAGNPTFAPSYQRGRLMPLARGAASKIILAVLSDRAKKSLHARTGKEFAAAGLGTNWVEFRTSLAAIRDAGYLVTYGEIDEGVIGISAPISVAEGTALGSVSYVISNKAVNKDSLEQMGLMLKSAAAQITAMLVATRTVGDRWAK
jgi:DNA-binding IclR family transcriptional regulator